MSAAIRRNHFPSGSKIDQNFSSDEDSSSETVFSDHENDNDNDNDHEDENAEMCLICAENIEVASLSPCNHKVCHLCSFRNVALYKKAQCLVCRTDVPHFIFTEDLKIDKFDSIGKKKLLPTFKGDFGVRYTSEKAKSKTVKLLDYTCPVKSCDQYNVALANFKELSKHVNEVHSKYYCDLCVKFKKAFISELKLYNRNQLHKHQTKGDSLGFKGHPECQFCTNKRFYSDDEKFIHMREKHERCHICQEIDPNNPQYFKDYNHLSQHFQSAHYVCHVQSCLDQKFIVFKDEFELQTHMAKEHSNLYGKNIYLTQKTFNSQLFTVPSEKKKNKNESSNNNVELKQKRLEERAKHYLNNSSSKMDAFIKYNQKYREGAFTANVIIQKYHELFKDSKDVDYELLLFELSNLFPEKSNLRKNLEAITKPQLNLRELKEQSPALPGVSNVLTNSGVWADSAPKSSKNIKRSGLNGLSSYDESHFPSLPTVSFQPTWVEPQYTTKKLPKTRGISSNTPVNGHLIPGYNPIDESSSKNKKKSTGFNNSNKNVWGSTTSVSTINPNAAAKKAAPIRQVRSVPIITSSSSSNSVLFDDSLCPSLPKVVVKKVPRVNPVNNSGGQWNSSGLSSASTGSTANDPFDMQDLGITLKIKKKKGKK